MSRSARGTCMQTCTHTHMHRDPAWIRGAAAGGLGTQWCISEPQTYKLQMEAREGASTDGQHTQQTLAASKQEFLFRAVNQTCHRQAQPHVFAFCLSSPFYVPSCLCSSPSCLCDVSPSFPFCPSCFFVPFVLLQFDFRDEDVLRSSHYRIRMPW